MLTWQDEHISKGPTLNCLPVGYVLWILIFFRWRCSFMINLVFGLPTMFAMMIFMLFWSHGPEGGYCTPPSPAPLSNLTDSDTSRTDHTRYSQPMVLPGLSWENLILWLLATPVQVGTTILVFCCLWLEHQFHTSYGSLQEASPL